MPTALDAVYEELKRLQLEGLDRVFIEDSTVALLHSAPRQQAETPSRPTEKIDISATSEVPSPSQPAAPHNVATPKTPPLPEQSPELELPPGDAAAQLQWLRETVENSATCQEHLRKGETVVFGNGAVDAQILFCGEAPDEDDAIAGEPFSGEAGQMLIKILRAMGLDPDSVYMTNILKWRPEHDRPYGNRPPTLEEMNYCLPFFKAEIEIVKPKVIVALGNTTIPALLGPESGQKMATLRGKWQSLDGIPLMFTLPPAYLLNSGTNKTKRMVWEDMLRIMEKVELPISEKQRGFFLPQ